MVFWCDQLLCHGSPCHVILFLSLFLSQHQTWTNLCEILPHNYVSVCESKNFAIIFEVTRCFIVSRLHWIEHIKNCHINPCETTRTLRSSDTLLFTVPFTRTELAKRAFWCAAPSVWNSLPSFITNSGSLTTFKSRLKTHFFRLSFDCSVHVWSHHIPASVSEVTTFWRYINQFIITIIIIIIIIIQITRGIISCDTIILIQYFYMWIATSHLHLYYMVLGLYNWFIIIVIVIVIIIINVSLYGGEQSLSTSFSLLATLSLMCTTLAVHSRWPMQQ